MDASGNVQGIKDALQRVKVLKVADYQRDYSWGPEQIDDLWKDVQVILEGDPNQEHFVGTLIFQKIDKDGHYELVDGQQRLTTIFMFMVSLLDQANFHSTKSIYPRGRTFNISQEIENFIFGEPEDSSEQRYFGSRIKPLVFLQKTFDSITDIELSRAERLRKVPKKAEKGDASATITLPLRRAYNHIDGLVADALSDLKTGTDSHLEEVNRIRKVLMEQFKVLTIHTDDLQDSLDVFMTLNNRGAPLGVFDLFRGEILKARLEAAEKNEKDDLFQDTLEEWKSIMQNLGSYSADKYLRHFALIKNKKEPDDDAELYEPKSLTMKALPQWTIAQIGKSQNPALGAKNLWEDVTINSEEYGYLLKPDGGQFEDYYLEALKLIGDSYRVLLLGVSPRKGEEWNKDSRIKLYALTYRLVTKWILSGGNAQKLENHFQRISHSYDLSPDTKRILMELDQVANFGFDLESRLLSEAPLDDSMAKSLLLILEANFSKKSAKIDLGKIQLEHVAPQKATSEWEQIIGDEYSSRVRDLGNLVLLDNKINSSTKQKPFAEKKEEYKKSRLVTVQHLQKVESWNPSFIDRRKSWLAKSLADLIENQAEPGIPDFH